MSSSILYSAVIGAAWTSRSGSLGRSVVPYRRACVVMIVENIAEVQYENANAMVFKLPRICDLQGRAEVTIGLVEAYSRSERAIFRPSRSSVVTTSPSSPPQQSRAIAANEVRGVPLRALEHWSWAEHIQTLACATDELSRSLQSRSRSGPDGLVVREAAQPTALDINYEIGQAMTRQTQPERRPRASLKESRMASPPPPLHAYATWRRRHQ